jgi:hypothetical protein
MIEELKGEHKHKVGLKMDKQVMRVTVAIWTYPKGGRGKGKRRSEVERRDVTCWGMERRSTSEEGLKEWEEINRITKRNNRRSRSRTRNKEGREYFNKRGRRQDATVEYQRPIGG